MALSQLTLWSMMLLYPCKTEGGDLCTLTGVLGDCSLLRLDASLVTLEVLLLLLVLLLLKPALYTKNKLVHMVIAKNTATP